MRCWGVKILMLTIEATFPASFLIWIIDDCFSRLIGQRYQYQYGESIPCEQLVSWLCDIKQVFFCRKPNIFQPFLSLESSVIFMAVKVKHPFLFSGVHPVRREEALWRLYPVHGLGQALRLPAGMIWSWYIVILFLLSVSYFLPFSTSRTHLATMGGGKQLVLGTTGTPQCLCWSRSTRFHA